MATSLRIHIAQEDEETPGLWYIRIGGIASGGQAKLSSETIIRQLGPDETPQDWLDTNQAEAQELVDAGEYYERHADAYHSKDMLKAIQGEIEWLNEIIPNASGVTKRLAQQNRAMLRAWRYTLKRFNT